VSSPHWRGWLSASSRCLVPATSFCEYEDTKPRKTPTWFALSGDRPLFAFAGLWTRWQGVRGSKSAPVDGEHELFGFLTTEPNAIVAPIHPKAMPVILTTTEEFDLWLDGETVEALKLQRPLPDGMLDIVASGEKEDPPVEAVAFRTMGRNRASLMKSTSVWERGQIPTPLQPRSVRSLVEEVAYAIENASDVTAGVE
jgi:putative SOS response-associated peptidase YedK